jgi:quinol monooxygenase YgiN
MLRYIMTFSVMEGRLQLARKIIDKYFDHLHRNGPGGMRSQCYFSDDNERQFVHIKNFKKESAANHHFRTQPFKEYIEDLSSICEDPPLSFSRLEREQTFESIY